MEKSLKSSSDRTTASPSWFCLHTQPKHEHIAAARLRQLADVAVFCPRLRSKRVTRRGPVWFVEALFPGYLFARFDLHALCRQVRSAQGVIGILRFGQRYASVEEAVIEKLRESVGDAEVLTLASSAEPGDTVRIVAGIFHGLEAVVLQVLPAKTRIKVLLDFLGRQVETELEGPAVLSKLVHPLSA